MKKTLIATLLSAVIAAPAFAADTYNVDPTHTWPSFEINHLGFSTQRGRFEKTAGTIVLDMAKKSGSVDISIDAASINMGFEKWNAHVKSEDFFNVEKHPKITFKSSKLNFNNGKLASVDGDFTLMGVTKPVTLTVTNFKCGHNPIVKKDACGADASATIKRSDFGMKTFVPAVSDEVKLVLNVEAHKN
jgi:polyisoprenoid-binding protein YceI